MYIIVQDIYESNMKYNYVKQNIKNIQLTNIQQEKDYAMNIIIEETKVHLLRIVSQLHNVSDTIVYYV